MPLLALFPFLLHAFVWSCPVFSLYSICFGSCFGPVYEQRPNAFYTTNVAWPFQNMLELPENNSQYGNLAYWNERYNNQDGSYDWFKNYGSFRHIIKEVVFLDDRILMLGCGNSTLSEEMYNDGYHKIINIDYSPVVIEKMKSHSEICSAMEWLEMDIKNLTFPKKSFDVIIEKGTLDAMMVNEKDPWNISKKTSDMLENVFLQLNNILKTDGRFVSITFSQPHFRRKLLVKPSLSWSFEYFTLGETFHYFVYVMTKGKKWVTDCKNTENCIQHTVNLPTFAEEDNDPEYIFKICL